MIPRTPRTPIVRTVRHGDGSIGIPGCFTANRPGLFRIVKNSVNGGMDVLGYTFKGEFILTSQQIEESGDKTVILYSILYLHNVVCNTYSSYYFFYYFVHNTNYAPSYICIILYVILGLYIVFTSFCT